MIVGNLIKQIRASYSAKLIVIFIIALCLMATVLNITSNRIQRQSYTEYMRSSGLAMSQLLAKSVQLDVFAEDVKQLTNPVESLLAQENILQVEILNSQGLPIISRRAVTRTPLPDPVAILTDIQQNAPSFKEWPSVFSYWWPVKALPTISSDDELYFDASHERLSKNHAPLGYVYILVSKKAYEKNIKKMALRTGLTIFLILILVVTGTLLLTRRMTLPLRNLVHKIQEQRHIAEVQDDIGLLDTTVTSLIDELDHSFQTINDLTNDLEDKIVERTRQLADANDELLARHDYLEEANLKLEKAMQELRVTENHLIQSEKMAAIGQVVAGVAHEINNNINFISGALPSIGRAIADIKSLTEKFKSTCQEPTETKISEAAALLQDLEDNEIFDSLDLLMDNVHEGVNRTTRIITDLRTFSRADDQGYKAVDLHQSLDSTITFLDKTLLDGVEIVKEYGQIPVISCLPDRINQVFLNIMNNALHAMAAQGGTLTITTFLKNSQIHFRFCDTGTGISSEVLPKIFEPFFTSKDIGEGSGIGLAISYTIIQQHNGRIEVTSDVGKGSCFEVILPVNHTKTNASFTEV